MSDSFFSSPFFIILAVVIFILRTVSQLGKKKSPPPPRPRIPVHFEDEADDDDEAEFRPAAPGGSNNERYLPYLQSRGASDYFKGLAAAEDRAAAKTAAPGLPSAVRTVPVLPEIPAAPAANVSHPLSEDYGEADSAAAKPAFVTKEIISGQKAFNLGYLSPLKQAVVMAEILGRPKGMTQDGNLPY